jgi:hypothetical protein
VLLVVTFLTLILAVRVEGQTGLHTLNLRFALLGLDAEFLDTRLPVSLFDVNTGVFQAFKVVVVTAVAGARGLRRAGARGAT